MSTIIGSLVATLSMDGAEFHRNIGKAREGLKDLGGSSSFAEKKLADVAAKGFGVLVPAVHGFESQIARVIDKTANATGLLGVLGQTAIIAGGALVVAAGVQALQHWIKTGEAIWKVKANLEALTKAANDERTAIEKRVTLQRSLMTEVLKLQGDELGALRLAEEAKRQEIEKTFAAGAARDNAMALNARSFYLQREKLGIDAAAKESAAQIKAWQDETAAFIAELTKRKTARESFVSQLGQGGMGGQTAASGFGAARALQEQFRKDLKDIGFLEREGLLSKSAANDAREERRRKFLESVGILKQEFSAFPTVIEAIQKSADSIDFSKGFGAEIVKANDWIRDNIATLDELKGRHDTIHEYLTTKLPAGVDRAGQELKKLGDAWVELAWDIYAVNQQLIAFDKLGGE